MKFLNKLIDAINKLPASVKTYETFMLITAGIALILFFAILITMLVKKPKFIKSAKEAVKCLEAGELNQLNGHIGKMPKSQVNSWKQYLKTRAGKPSAAFAVESCVNTPYSSSVAVTAPVAMGIVSVIVTLFMGMFAIIIPFGSAGIVATIVNSGIVATVLVAIISSILTLILYLVSRSIYKKSTALYEKFCVLLDSKIGASAAQPEQESQDNYARAENAHDTDDNVMVVAEGYMQDNEPVQAEVVNTEPVIEIVQEDTRAAEAQAQAEEQARAQAKAEKIAAAQAQAEEQARAKERAEKIAAAQAAQAQAAQAAQQANTAQQAEAQAAPRPASAQRPAGNEDIVARIDRMTAEGATQQQMREVAMILQQERQKPENKTPEQTRRLNDALAKLLKAMSTAPKA